MSINIKTLKNLKKISKDFSKVIKKELQMKPNLRIGIDWKDDFLKVTNNLKKIKKLDWSESKIFPMAIYKHQQLVSLDKGLINNFVDQINFNKVNYEDLYKILNKLISENRSNDLFLFNTTGGVDLLLFFIDSRGNFVFNDFESKKCFLNESNNGNDIVSTGIKSILKARKIICFCIEESSKDVLAKLNKKYIDEDDVLTYLQMHDDITLYTLTSIIRKNEVNHDSMTQNIYELKEKLLNTKDENIFNHVEEPNETLINSEQLDLDNLNKNMNNLDNELPDSIRDDNQNQLENQDYYDDGDQEDSNENLFTENLEEKIVEQENKVELLEELENEIEQIVDDIKHDDIHEYSKDENTKADEIDGNDDEKINLFNINEKSESNHQQPIASNDIKDNYTFDEDKKLKSNYYNHYFNSTYDANGLPDDPEALRKFIEIKKDTLKQIEDIFLENKLVELKNKTQEKYLLLKKMRELNASYAKTSKQIVLEKNKNNEKNINIVHYDRHISIDNSPTTYFLEYVPGIRPTPLLMVWHDKNSNFYYELLKNMHKNFDLKLNLEFDENNEHVWNDGCYIVYDKAANKIKSLAFESEDRFLFLLRFINKPITLEIDSINDYHIFKNLFKTISDEIKVDKK